MPPSSAIQQSLSSQLPTYASRLPATLINLCESLLARSRQRAANLKPDEEIARAYACCEIACKRLRAQCRLPAVKTGGAPCKPAVYKKLLIFLERVLDDEGTAATTSTTPQKSASKKRTANGNIKPVVESPKKTPTRKSMANTFVGKIKSSHAPGAQSHGEAPKFTMPSIRTLCKTFSTPLLAPHVYTGTCVVLKLAGLWPRDEQDQETGEERWKDNPRGSSFDEVVTGLLIALYLMTLTKMQSAKMTTTVYKATCSRSAEVLEYKPGAPGVEEWIRTINRDGYCRGQDWWGSVPDSVFDFDPNNDRDLYEFDHDDGDDELLAGRSSRRRLPPSARSKRREEEKEEQDDPEGVLLPGLATMMQDAYDLLSEDRQHDFAVWKTAFLRRLDKLDKQPPRPSSSKAVAAK
ncbi:uncharacterized protein A1O9_09789 [Exophiala aquamarina CBS 119918]|uniref:ORC6 first cyclin-like domain-containing protein n=1 Tax=Exophiala aquamarina CBS 119918 TaxID=1182545 RepID=A0A072P1K0_9EURO|nr:uncharacterized protein A1O9_09789 [Exophiala aquamarina CBS 119918]KEF53994.1 hypothetical protein A1O9_09789 [Exophiala aquamarina CBS 119918]